MEKVNLKSSPGDWVEVRNGEDYTQEDREWFIAEALRRRQRDIRWDNLYWRAVSEAADEMRAYGRKVEVGEDGLSVGVEPSDSYDAVKRNKDNVDYEQRLVLRAFNSWSFGETPGALPTIQELKKLRGAVFNEVCELSSDFLTGINATFTVDEVDDPDSPTIGSETSDSTSVSEPPSE